MWQTLQIWKAQTKWDGSSNLGKTDFNWWHIPEIVGHYNKKVCGKRLSGGNAAGCREYLRQRWPNRKFENAVSIGCGTAAKEIALVETGIVQHIELFEISKQRIAEAWQLIEDKNLAGCLSFANADPLNDWTPRYDLVYWDHALHHMFDVERYIKWSKAVLVEGGVLSLNDYVGPNRLQWSDHNVELCNDFLQKVNKDHGQSIDLIAKSGTLSNIKMLIRDPSEAPQSERIIPSCREIFEDVEAKPIGGYLYLVLGNILRHLRDDKGLIESLIRIDEEVCKEHFHYAFLAWEKMLKT